MHAASLVVLISSLVGHLCHVVAVLGDVAKVSFDDPLAVVDFKLMMVVAVVVGLLAIIVLIVVKVGLPVELLICFLVVQMRQAR